MKRSIIVIDDFYVDPDPVREWGLQQEYGVSGNYPGMRSVSYKGGGVKEGIEGALGVPLCEEFWNREGYNGAFQYVTEEEKTWVHADIHNEYAAIIFLTPDPPVHTGTAFYQNKLTKDYRWNNITGPQLNTRGSNYEDWDKVEAIENRYNRCIIYDAFLFHAAEGYFGNNLQNSRLFQTFFFNPE